MSEDRLLTPNSLWQHYKGKHYKVIDVAYNANCDQDPKSKVVIYQALYDTGIYGDHSIWVREYDNFLDRVNGEYRFKKIS